MLNLDESDYANGEDSKSNKGLQPNLLNFFKFKET